MSDEKKNEPTIVKIDPENRFICIVNWHIPGDKRTASKRDVQVADADPEWFSGMHKIFKSPAYDELLKLRRDTNAWLKEKNNQAKFFESAILLKPSGAGKVDAKMREVSGLVGTLADQFSDSYEKLIEEARGRLNGAFNPRHYKTREAMRASIGVEWKFIEMSVPQTLAPEMRQAEIDKARAMWDEAAVEVRDGLRAGFSSLVEHLIDRLKPDEKTGKPKKFHESSITNLLDFVDALKDRDITNDSDLVALTAEAKRILEGATPEAIRKSTAIKESLIKQFAAVNERLDGMIGTEKRRKFDLD